MKRFKRIKAAGLNRIRGGSWSSAQHRAQIEKCYFDLSEEDCSIDLGFCIVLTRKDDEKI